MTVQHVDTPYLAATKDITTKRVRIEISLSIDQLVEFSSFSQILKSRVNISFRPRMNQIDIPRADRSIELGKTNLFIVSK